MLVSLKNINNDKLKAFKAFAKALDVKFRIKEKKPSAELLEAIKEIENGGGTLCKSMEEFDRQMAED